MGRAKSRSLILDGFIVVGVVFALLLIVIAFRPRQTDGEPNIMCVSNVKEITKLLIAGGRPLTSSHGGADLILTLVVKGDLAGERGLRTLFCPGDEEETYEKAGGMAAYANLDRSRGSHGHLTSYAGRALSETGCAVGKEGPPVILVCDDSEDHHFRKGFVVGWSDGGATYRRKRDDYSMEPEELLVIGKDSPVEELRCLRAE